MHPLRVYTVPCLIIGEIPTIIFTIFDMMGCFPAYREKNRPYPSAREMLSVMGVYTKNVAGILSVSVLGMEFFIQTDTVPYDMSENTSIIVMIYQMIQVTLFTEFLFYWLHRYVHYNKKLYHKIHNSHHRWRTNSFALVNHDLVVPEISVFSLCPAIPCIVLGVHWKVLLAHAILTNWQGTYSHSGYHFPILDKCLLTDPRDHDNHHKHPAYNFAGGGWFSLMDRIFGTYYHNI